MRKPLELRPNIGTGRSPSHGRTSADALLGTYDYMAPEQRGNLDAPISPATDVYAFCDMLYHLRTGRRPVDRAKPVTRLFHPRLDCVQTPFFPGVDASVPVCYLHDP